MLRSVPHSKIVVSESTSTNLVDITTRQIQAQDLQVCKSFECLCVIINGSTILHETWQSSVKEVPYTKGLGHESRP
jgi:hypothetical protein